MSTRKTKAQLIEELTELRRRVADLEALDAERKRAEEELSFKTALLEAQSEASIDGILVVDSEGKSILFNRRFGEMWNIAPEILETKSDEAMLRCVLGQLKHPEKFLEKVRYLYDHKSETSRDEIEFRNGRVFDRYSSPLLGSEDEYYGRIWFFRDVTERRRAEAALRRSEANLREAERIAHLGNWESDFEAGTLWWSEQIYHIFGLEPDEFDGTRDAFLDLVHPNDRARVLQALEEAIHENKPYDVEHRIVRPDGSVRTVHERAEVTRDEAGQPLRMLGTVQDITERKQVEESLRNSEALYSSLVETIPQFIFRKDLKGRFTFANRKFCAMLGKSLEEIVGKTDFDFYPAEMAEKYRRDDQAVVEQEALFDTVEENRKPDGEVIYVQVMKTPIHDARGRVVGVQGIFWDITERKRAEEALRAERDHSTRIITGTPAIICGIAPDGTTNFINPACEKITGYGAAELVGKNWWHILYPGEEHRQVEQLFRDFERGDVRDYEMVLTTKRGDRRTVLWNSINRFDEEGNLIEIVGFGNDITDRKRAEEQLRETMHELERSNTELEQFAYIASHDLQEPLRMVSSFTQLLARRYQDRLDQRADEYIAFAVDGAKRMHRLLEGLLAYSRVTTRARPFESTSCESVLSQAMDNLKLAIEDAGATTTHDPLPSVSADETQLVQLFQNLLGNALKFRGEEPPHIHLSAVQRDCEWEFSVRDNGIGIPPREKERVFQIFQRVHGRTEYPGTGIGLAVCRKIVERHKGQIWVESEVGQFTTFFFTLPVDQGRAA